MEKIVYIGIDPGKSGVITLFKDNEFTFINMPEHKVPSGKLSKKGLPLMKSVFHAEGFRQLVFDISQQCKGYKIKAAIEEVGGRAGWSAQNNFAFGHTAGLQLMILIMLKAEITFVRPQKWQSYMRQGYPDLKKASASGKTMISDPKAVAKVIVDTEYPNIDFRKSERANLDDDNRIDSFLICLYLIRTDGK